MNLLDLLDSVGGQQSLGNIASNLGLDASKTNDMFGSLMGGEGVDMDDVLNLAKKFF